MAKNARVVQMPVARAKVVRSLHRKKGRAEHATFLAEGERLLDELARSRSTERIRFVFGDSENIPWLLERFPDVQVYQLTGSERDLFATDSPQGVGAVVENPPACSVLDLAAPGLPLLLLDSIADPGNLGTIIRSAEWFGLGGVMLTRGCSDPFGPKAVRASMGAIFRLPIAVELDPAEAASTGLPLIALEGSASEQLGHIRLPWHAIYVVGSEAHGVSTPLLELSRGVAIRGSGAGESLNAAIAASILCYELTRLDKRA